MPRDRFPPDDPREWIKQARSSLHHAKAESPIVDLENLCFDAQQSAEKAIQAVFIARGNAFPYVHNLAELLTLLLRAGEDVPLPTKQAAELSRFATVTRYPGVAEPVTQEDYRRAVRIAETVFAWAEARVAILRAEAGG